MAGYVLLGMGGPALSRSDREQGLLILDGTWRLAGNMERDFTEIPIRSLLPWKTAYPRVSKLYEDPAGGLATIEALYAAYVQMGRPAEDLLSNYRWREEFLEINAALISSLTGP